MKRLWEIVRIYLCVVNSDARIFFVILGKLGGDLKDAMPNMGITLKKILTRNASIDQFQNTVQIGFACFQNKVETSGSLLHNSVD
jgi:hypothetical protein